MTKHIENSDRGITLNKSLAWTMAGGLVGMGLYVGLTIATLSTKVDNLANVSGAARVERNGVEVRVRILENTASQYQAQFEALNLSLSEIKQDQREMNALLRQFLNQRLSP